MTTNLIIFAFINLLLLVFLFTAEKIKKRFNISNTQFAVCIVLILILFYFLLLLAAKTIYPNFIID